MYGVCIMYIQHKYIREDFMAENIIATVNQKGGVGKTATATNLAYCLAISGKKTLLIDFDPSKNASKVYCPNIPLEPTIKDVLINKDYDCRKAIIPCLVNGNPVENLYLIPSRIQLGLVDLTKRAHKEKILSKQIKSIENYFDYIIIDCPPTLSDLTSNAIYASDYILIPVSYENDALEGVNDLFDVINDVKEDAYFEYKILKNGCDNRKKTVIQFIEHQLAPFSERGNVLKTIIRQDEEINKAKINGFPVMVHSPKSPGSLDFMKLTEEIING